MAGKEHFSDMSADERQAEREWEERHAGRNSAASYALAIAELRRKHVAGEPILSREYGPRLATDDRNLLHQLDALV
jgi:hypothetical protein